MMKNFLSIISLIVLGFSLWFGISSMPGEMFIAVIAFFTLLFFANLDRISEFKASKSGFEAKTREVKEIVEEAKITIKQIQILSKIVASTTLSLVKRSGRMGGYSDDEEEKIKESILNVLLQLKISKEECEDVLKEWHKFIEFDYTHYILGGPNVPPNLNPKQIEKWEELRRSGLMNIPSPETLTQFLNQCDLLSDETKEVIEDLKYYIGHRKHRRPDIWKKRKEWAHLSKNIRMPSQK